MLLHTDNSVSKMSNKFLLTTLEVNIVAPLLGLSRWNADLEGSLTILVDVYSVVLDTIVVVSSAHLAAMSL